ncbi:MAG: hypothetical protein QW837_09680 [Conexivisphaerales archaeon]
MGWTGFFGAIMLISGLILRPNLNDIFIVLGLINLISYFLVYQYGVFKTNSKYSLLMLILQIPIALYEGGTLVYSTLLKPDKNKFEVIKKA